MKRIFGFLLLVGMAFSALGGGLIIIHEPDFWRPWPPWPPYPPPYPIPPPPPRPIPPPHPVWAPLEVTFTKGDVKIRDQVAVTKIEQEFYNPNPRQLEGTFLFPLPKGAHLDKFTMEINGKPVEAELMAADKARSIYEDIVRKLRDPALLEYADKGLLKARIFPIEPHSKKRVTISYTQVLKSDGGMVGYVFPLNTEKYSAQPVRTVSVRVDLESKRALKNIYSPSHKVEIKREGEKRAIIGFEASNVKPDADFQLFYTITDSEIGVNLMTYKPAGEDGYFLLLASPGLGTRKVQVMPKDVVFVLDTSGSMAGAKLDQAKKALLFCVENLNESDRFEILRFSTEVEPLFDKLTEVSKDNRARARSFIEGLKPLGGTAIDDALRKALALRPSDKTRPYVIIFLTDGRPTIGETDENKIVKNATSAATGVTRIFCFGIGTDVNTHLLDRITEETKAFSQYVLPEEDLEVKVSSFFTKIKEPVLADTRLQFTGNIRTSKMYPSPLPDLFNGEQLIVAGRYTGKGSSAVIIEGNVAGEPRRFSFDVEFGETTEHDFIPRLWATRRVGYLLDEIRLRGETKELKDEVTELARQYGIVTPYTAYLIVEDEQRRGVAQNVQTFRRLAETDRFLSDGREQFRVLQRERDGGAAVAGARAAYSLKAAENALSGITASSADGLRAMPSAITPIAPSGGRGGARYNLEQQADREQAAQDYVRQARYINGRTFYWNGSQWVDANAQKLGKTQPIRVQFGSEQYLELLRKHPAAAAWFSLGNNIQLVLDGNLYEIHE